jgi:NADH-quinone oxidoreductase subunit H
MGGWASNSKWSLLGGMRSAAQIISYELPASMALLTVATMTGSLSTQRVIEAQGGMPWHWNVFKTPFGFACFFVYFISALAEGNRTPFDLPEAESELVSGYNTEYSGFRFGIYPMVEWINLYVVSAVATTAFLGGWRLPGVRLEAIEASTLLTLLAAAVFLAKVVALVFVIIWIRWSLPRFRVDQMMALCWKYFLPISLACFLGVTAWLWLVPAAVQEVTGILTFLVCGICLGAYFASRVRFAYRSTPRPAGGTP